MLNKDSLNKLKHKLALWEDPKTPTAPLTQSQLDVIDLISKSVTEKSYPVDVAAVEPFTPTTLDFLTQFAILEDELTINNDYKAEFYQSQLENWFDETNSLLGEVAKTLGDFEKLREQHRLVSENTGSLHEMCQNLTAEQGKLSELSVEISGKLDYLTCLDGLQQRLLNPSLSVSGGTFYLALGRLDQCLEYIKAHGDYKDAGAFKAQANFILSRAIATMREAVLVSFQHATKQVLEVQTETDMADGEGFALCVGRFQAAAGKARHIIRNVEERKHVAVEYERLLADCAEAYVGQRKLLLAASVSTAIVELTNRHKGDHSTLLRSACGFLLHICTDEHHLYFHFFLTPTQYLSDYLDGLCTNLYDILRPIIIHVNHLETLAELCSILQLELLDEQIASNPVPLESLHRVVLQLLQDVQERLVFRAHVYLQSDILNYNPSPGDIAYPEKLQMMENIANSMHQLRRSDSRLSLASSASQEVERLTGSPADLHAMWYPPVRRTLVTLSRLYRCVDRSIFQGLSQEALSMCVNNISKAASAISNRSSRIDGQLFEMKHLLILREQVAPFHVDFTVKETTLDFTRVKSAVYNLIQKRNRLFSLSSNNALLEFLLEGAPTVKQSTIDSRKEVDKQLKAVCEAFIHHCAELLAGRIISLTKEIKGHKTELGSLKTQSYGTPDSIMKAVSESRKNIKAHLPQIIKALQLYLACKDTESLLYRHIKNQVFNEYQSLTEISNGTGYTDEDRLIMALPTAEQLLLMFNSSFQSHDIYFPIKEAVKNSEENV